MIGKATLRMFKAIPVNTLKKDKIPSAILGETISKGYIFSPEVCGNYSIYDLNKLMRIVDEELALAGHQFNASFHKSWTKVKYADIELLITEQITHYITTYGYEAMGFFDSDRVYIPHEKLSIPNFDGSLPLLVIKGYTKAQLKEKLLDLLSQGVALKQETVDDAVEIATFVGVGSGEIHQIKNKETRCILYSKLSLVPKDPTEFLRLVVYTVTDKTLLIKDKQTIQSLKDADKSENSKVFRLFALYNKVYGMDSLSQIFYRFKPLFLALKNSDLNWFINRLRKEAPSNHKPLPEDFLNNVTAYIGRGEIIPNDLLTEKLSSVNTFRKIRLAYALKYRTLDTESIMYKIRNGKSYATTMSETDPDESKRVYNMVLKSIANDLSKNVYGQKILIPENIVYSLPATEKQFTGNYPSGSYVELKSDMIVGVHWENVAGNRIDLDLSMSDMSHKIGWDADYRSDDGRVLFSGDLTNAPLPTGATESIYTAKSNRGLYTLNLNYFNAFESSEDVPYKFFIAHENVGRLPRGHTVNPNNIIFVVPTKITAESKSVVLGFVATTPNHHRFYFNELKVGNERSSRSKSHKVHMLKYFENIMENPINLETVLEMAGAFIVRSGKADIDLSPTALEKDTILKLFYS